MHGRRPALNLPAMSQSTRRSPTLAHVRVLDCMHHGILSCDADAPLSEAARIMARHRVHALAVTNGDVRRPIGVLSSQDIVAAAARGEDPAARRAAIRKPLAVSSDEHLARATQLMAEYGVAHLVVVDAASGYPIGVLSTLDVAAVYGGSSAERRDPPPNATLP